MKSKRRKVEIVSQNYQPTKVEAEEVIVLRRKDRSAPTAQDLARAVVQSLEITYIDKPQGE